MGTDQNPYQAYTDGSIFSDNPLNLVIALYEGALDATSKAEHCLRSGDIMGRSKAINKTISILTELITSLDIERGGEIGGNLKRLYSYMQVRLLAAHAGQKLEPVLEVASLLKTLLDGWRGASKSHSSSAEIAVSAGNFAGEAKQLSMSPTFTSPAVYSGYMNETADTVSGTAYSF